MTRNRAKRVLREAARRLPWREGTDIVLIARARCAASGMHAVQQELHDLALQLDALAAVDTGDRRANEPITIEQVR